MSMQQHVILNTVDTPLKILFWTVPELLMWVVPLFTGLMLNQVMLGALTSLLYVWGAKHYRRHFAKGNFQAVKYWFLPTDRRLKTLPPSFIREYLG